MAALQIKNNAYSTLAAGLTNVDTTLTVSAGHGARFPALVAGDWFMLTLQDAANNIEIIKVTAHASGADSMTIARGQEGTAARAWAIGDVVEMRLTAGIVTLNDATQTLTNKTINLGGNTLSTTLAQLNAAVSDADIPGSDGTGSSGIWPISITGSPGDGTVTAQKLSADILNRLNDYKASVRAATTASINLSAPGAAIDGVAMVVGDRFLDKDNATASARGIYIWNGAAVPATRATDADGVGELTSGAMVAVEEGTTLADSQWMLTTDGAITIGTTPLTFVRKDAVSAATGFRNKIINGGMAVDQRNAGAAQTFTAAAALAYCVDRWYGYCTGANVTGQRVAGAGADQYRYRFTGAASVTGIGFGQRIEKLNCIDLAGSTATLSVDLANSLLTTVTWTAYYANTDDTFGSLASPTRTQIATGSFTVNSTVTRYNTQIAIPAGASTGIELVFSVGAQTSGTWTIGNVQLEAGSTATAFERRPIGLEFYLAERYCIDLSLPTGGSSVCATYTTAASQLNYIGLSAKQMRATPTASTITAGVVYQCTAAPSGPNSGLQGVILTSTVGGLNYVYGSRYRFEAEL